MAEDDNKVTRCYAKYIFLDVVQFSKRSAEANLNCWNPKSDCHQALKSFEVTFDDSILIPTGDGLCITLIKPSFPYDIHIQLALEILNRTHESNAKAEKETRQFHVTKTQIFWLTTKWPKKCCWCRYQHGISDHGPSRRRTNTGQPSSVTRTSA